MASDEAAGRLVECPLLCPLSCPVEAVRKGGGLPPLSAMPYVLRTYGASSLAGLRSRRFLAPDPEFSSDPAWPTLCGATGRESGNTLPSADENRGRPAHPVQPLSAKLSPTAWRNQGSAAVCRTFSRYGKGAPEPTWMRSSRQWRVLTPKSSRFAPAIFSQNGSRFASRASMLGEAAPKGGSRRLDPDAPYQTVFPEN